MIFICVTKSVKPAYLDRDDDIRQQPPPQFQKQANIVYSVSGCFLKIKKKPFGLRTWKGHLKPRVLLEQTLLVSDMRSLKEADCYPRRGQRGGHISMLIPSTRQQSDITQFYTVWKQLPTLNSLNSTLVGDLSFHGRVETLRQRLGHLVYCWK